MTDQIGRALACIAATAKPDALRQIAANARNKSDLVERAAIRRLAEVSARHCSGTVEHDCWVMIHVVEELRRARGRTVSRMNRMRPKIERDGEIADLEYCALQETDGFTEIMQYGMPDLTAEAIVLKHRHQFSEKAVSSARSRLEAHGVRIDNTGNILVDV